MDSISTATPADKKKKGTIRFEQRTEKIDKDGKAPVRLIYQVRGQRKYYNTGQKLLQESWDPKNQEAIYIDRKTAKKLHPAIDYDLLLTESEAATLNGKLQDIQKLIDSIEQRFEMDKIIYSAEMAIEKLNEIEKRAYSLGVTSHAVVDETENYY